MEKACSSILKNQNGFSLVEALVNLLVAFIVVAGVHAAIVYGMRGAVNQKDNIITKTIASQIISGALGSGNMPPLLSEDGTSATYVQCFDKDGVVAVNKFGRVTPAVSVKPLKGVESNICVEGFRYEARVFRKDEQTMNVEIWGYAPSRGKLEFIIFTKRDFEVSAI